MQFLRDFDQNCIVFCPVEFEKSNLRRVVHVTWVLSLCNIGIFYLAPYEYVIAGKNLLSVFTSLFTLYLFIEFCIRLLIL